MPDAFAPQLGINQTGSFDWDQGYPGTVIRPDANTPPISPALFPVVSVDPRALKLGYSEAFNFGIEHELTPNTRLEVAYVGNRGHHLTDTALAWNQGPTATFQRLAQQGVAYNYVCSPADAAQFGVPYPSGNQYVYGNFCASTLAAIAPYPQLADAEGNYWGYANLNYVGLPLGQSFYDSMVVDVVKRTGRGLTMDMSYTWSRQEGDSFSSQQEGNNYYTGVQDFGNMRQAAHAVTGYDLAHVVKGFVSYELPFGRGRQSLAGQNHVVNGIVSGWTLTGLVKYYTGAPFHVGAANPYWPLWGDIYPQFNLAGYTGPNNPRHYVPIPAGQTTIPAQDVYIPQSVASNPSAGYLPPSPGTSALRCPGQADEDASLLKNFNMGSDGRYRLTFRTEFYNIFNRHYYNINGCYGNNQNSIGAANWGQIFGVVDGPRNGQFAIRFEF